MGKSETCANCGEPVGRYGRRVYNNPYYKKQFFCDNKCKREWIFKLQKGLIDIKSLKKNNGEVEEYFEDLNKKNKKTEIKNNNEPKPEESMPRISINEIGVNISKDIPKKEVKKPTKKMVTPKAKHSKRERKKSSKEEQHKKKVKKLEPKQKKPKSEEIKKRKKKRNLDIEPKSKRYAFEVIEIKVSKISLEIISKLIDYGIYLDKEEAINDYIREGIKKDLFTERLTREIEKKAAEVSN
jgi:hypothetical protein